MKRVETFADGLSRKEIIRKSLDNFGYLLVAENTQQAIDAANQIASEHLEIMMEHPFEVMTKIQNAGAIFIGDYSSEPLGRLFCRTEPYPADEQDGKILFAFVCRRFLSRSPASSTMERKHWNRFTGYYHVCRVRAADRTRKILSVYVLKKNLKEERV